MNNDSSVTMPGGSRTALILATGYKVRVYQPSDSNAIKLRP